MQASQTSSANDFDFYLGKWKIRNRKLKSRLTGSNEWEEFESTDHVAKILNGAGNFGQYHAVLENKPFAGITLRLFDPSNKLWSLYWADSIHAKLDIPVVGYFENKIGKFYCRNSCGDILSTSYFAGMPPTLIILYGARHFQPTAEKPGNGTGICITNEYQINKEIAGILLNRLVVLPECYYRIIV